MCEARGDGGGKRSRADAVSRHTSRRDERLAPNSGCEHHEPPFYRQAHRRHPLITTTPVNLQGVATKMGDIRVQILLCDVCLGGAALVLDTDFT